MITRKTKQIPAEVSHGKIMFHDRAKDYKEFVKFAKKENTMMDQVPLSQNH